MNMSTDNIRRIALVTASSRGIGYACAESMAKLGHIVAMCSRDKSRIEEAALRIAEETGGETHPYVCDLREPDQVHGLFQSIYQDCGRIDILVFNSGSPPSGSFFSATDDDWLEGHRLCMEPTIQLARAVLPGMIERRWGRIVLINSIFGKEPDVGYAVSSAERAAQLALMKCLSRQTADKGVTVNAILPGFVDTPLVREYAEDAAKARQCDVNKIMGEWASSIPRKMLAHASEIGELSAWLVGKSSTNISGCTIQSDGGMMRGF